MCLEQQSAEMQILGQTIVVSDDAIARIEAKHERYEKKLESLQAQLHTEKGKREATEVRLLAAEERIDDLEFKLASERASSYEFQSRLIAEITAMSGGLPFSPTSPPQ
jgi:predicted RNase H-like nuclease (RuvC/YqgF family)